MDLTYRRGIDGWLDDCIALTRPWGFELSALTTPVSVWYGPADVLGSRGQQEYLLGAIAGAQRRELHGGHVLDYGDLAAIYGWLTNPTR